MPPTRPPYPAELKRQIVEIEQEIDYIVTKVDRMEIFSKFMN